MSKRKTTVHLPWSKKPRVKKGVEGPGDAESRAAWRRADESLDHALRETFPASDALSITQGPLRARYQ
jgi:hypothetical protein